MCKPASDIIQLNNLVTTLSILVNFVLISSVAPMDYEAVSTTLMFAACEKRRCVNVVIVEDIIVESIETFGITLERTPDLDSNITLTPVAEQIEIIDNDCKEQMRAIDIM